MTSHRPRLRVRLGRAMQQRRCELGLTQAEVAERADVSEKHYGEIERGEVNASLETLERVAKPLGWEFCTFLGTAPLDMGQDMLPLMLAELGKLTTCVNWLKEWAVALASRQEVPGHDSGGGRAAADPMDADAIDNAPRRSSGRRQTSRRQSSNTS